ncbi:MAG TPA: class I SAM-dependent methyltransferase [Chitinophagales bacterium]|nr:class I SAM-dependent methyltransferase [Chitinophagales bacterium]
MNIAFRVKKYISYLVNAKTKYYLHSPFVYEFYLNVLEGPSPRGLEPVIALRQQLKNNDTAIEIEDFGTGNKHSRPLANIERNVSIKHKYGLLLNRLVQYFRPLTIVEIGTSIGLSSSYMALADTKVKIVTLEGSSAIAGFARQNHQQLKIDNVDIITGNFSNTLYPALDSLSSLDLVFFDGNHTKEATLEYFNLCLAKANEQTVFVFDDIYWSEGMCSAWQEIKQHPRVRLTIDVYQFGICFFNKEKLAKEDFVLLY